MLVRYLRLPGPAIALLLLVSTVARADIEKLAPSRSRRHQSVVRR
jgi:hypothetical protein